MITKMREKIKKKINLTMERKKKMVEGTEKIRKTETSKIKNRRVARKTSNNQKSKMMKKFK